jgi:threonine/homoserine/homoserine lactone efflux protein
MAALLVAFDFVWYTTLAVVASRATQSFAAAAWLERAMGAVLVCLGVRVAREQR